ncbi:MAG TPA: carbamate kinase [Gemmatimonadales bacterium]|jgi:carbamate kinase|nr:carbamate kinase [Gemmatimonadales bacterium]
MRTAVLALGGNALARAGERPTITNQFRHARNSVAPIVQLAKDGWGIAIVHGNGPQVGDELVRNEVARNLVEPLPLGVLVANTAGWIGYMLQQSLQNALRFGQVQRDVITLITQTLVDPYDPALTRPTKPIGHPLSDELAAQLRETGIAIGRDGAGHWRRLAASPLPTGVVELELIRRLLGQNVIVVAGGGGGPPVYDHPLLGYEGLEAVVDKDRVAAILARQLDAEVLLILTDVDAVYAGWGTPSARPLLRLTLDEVDELIAAGGVNEGGMKPKVQAAADFVRSGGGRAIVARLNDGPAALRGEVGTTIARS